MKNRTGVQVPTEKQIQGLIADIEAIEARIQTFTVSLSAAERLGATKMRPGGENVVASLVQLADRHDISLPKVSSAAISANLTLAHRVRPLAESTRNLLRRLDDTVINAQGQCWWSATALYTALARVAKATPDLQAALRPIVAFFANGPRKGPGTPPASGTPPTPPVSSAA